MTTENKSTKEIWKPIENYEGLYEVSNLGRVKSLKRRTKDGRSLPERILRQSFQEYYRVGLTINSKQTMFLVHRLVAETFLPNTEDKPQVNHINGIKEDNRLSNLEWATNKENSNHAWENGLSKVSLHERPKGEKNSNSKLTEADVRYMRSNPKSLTQRELSKRFNVSQVTICRILKGLSWTHV